MTNPAITLAVVTYVASALLSHFEAEGPSVVKGLRIIMLVILLISWVMLVLGMFRGGL